MRQEKKKKNGSSSRSSKAGSHGGRRYGARIDVCGCFPGNIRNTLNIAETEKAVEYTIGNGEWQRTRKKCAVAVVACNEDKVNPVTLKWKWGEDELPSQTSMRTLAERPHNNAHGMNTSQK